MRAVVVGDAGYDVSGKRFFRHASERVVCVRRDVSVSVRPGFYTAGSRIVCCPGRYIFRAAVRLYDAFGDGAFRTGVPVECIRICGTLSAGADCFLYASALPVVGGDYVVVGRRASRPVVFIIDAAPDGACIRIVCAACVYRAVSVVHALRNEQTVRSVSVLFHRSRNSGGKTGWRCGAAFVILRLGYLRLRSAAALFRDAFLCFIAPSVVSVRRIFFQTAARCSF